MELYKDLWNTPLLPRFKTPDISAEFKAALDAAVVGLEAAAPAGEANASAAVSTAKPAKSEEKSTGPAAAGDEILFRVEDFKPLTDVGEEKELSFEGLGLKLNTQEDAKDVASKVRGEKVMHTLTLAGNTVGIDAAKAIGSALEVHPEFRRAHWKDMFTGRVATDTNMDGC